MPVDRLAPASIPAVRPALEHRQARRQNRGSQSLTRSASERDGLEVGDKALLLDSIRIASMGIHEDGSAMAARSRLRRERLVAHRASGHADAEAWDLDFWQSQSPEDRLSALVAIRRDVEVVTAGRKSGHD